jgi:hypothetical protein
MAGGVGRSSQEKNWVQGWRDQKKKQAKKKAQEKNESEEKKSM